MTHPAYLLARLNPKNARFDIGSGGLPEMTSTDVAGALALVPRGLGRELLCRVWWPDGAALTAKHLLELMEAVQRDEWASRESRMLDAMLAVASHKGGQSLQRAQGQFATAHAARWPKWVIEADIGTISPGYGLVRMAVLTEMSKPGLCMSCEGRGAVLSQTVVTNCASCRGTGRRQISDQWRADMLQITEGGYRKTWRPVYEWTLQLCVDEVDKASRHLTRAAT